MSETRTLTCFKAYDIRGAVPDELNADIAYGIGRAFADLIGAHRVAVGRDMRLSGDLIAGALVRGLNDAGVDVLDIGLSGTEEIYAATAQFGLDGGIAVTASHNPAHHNGMKLVRAEARPVSSDTGLNQIRDQVAATRSWPSTGGTGTTEPLDARPRYVEAMLEAVDLDAIGALRVVANAGNGCAGPAVDALAPHLPIQFTRLQWDPDGNFPNGVPNPLLLENREITAEAVRAEGADFGVAWDGDFDRCFFFDAHGRFIEGYYLVGLLAKTLLPQTSPGTAVVHDPRLLWNTLDIVEAAGGVGVQCKAGHAFIKEAMRNHDAIYGGEMSSHHFFRDFFYCDSGMLPWLHIASLMGRSGATLAELVDERIAAYPCSGEINFRVDDAGAALDRVEAAHSDGDVDRTDGLSISYPEWRFNVRASNTEPLLRLNVETRANQVLLDERTQALTALITNR